MAIDIKAFSEVPKAEEQAAVQRQLLASILNETQRCANASVSQSINGANKIQNSITLNF